MSKITNSTSKRQRRSKQASQGAKPSPAYHEEAELPATSVREGSKQALLVKLLSRANGASITELTDATGWQPHTTRAAITGLRKRGYEVVTSKPDGVFRYGVTGGPVIG